VAVAVMRRAVTNPSVIFRVVPAAWARTNRPCGAPAAGNAILALFSFGH
jgi:hypothetical protein